MSLPSYKKIDQSTWPRQDHYKYYTEKLKVNYSMTARLDVTRLRAECDRLGAFLCSLYLVYVKCCEPLAIYEDDDGRRRQSGSVGCCTPELYDLPQRRSHIF